MEEETANSSKTNNKPWLWKKGQSGNLSGRPKGKSLKAYAQEYLLKLNDKEKDEWLDGLEKRTVWSMAEGNPENKTDITTKGEKISTLPPEVIKLAKEYEEKIKKEL
jgi:hypothetical protein